MSTTATRSRRGTPRMAGQLPDVWRQITEKRDIPLWDNNVSVQCAITFYYDEPTEFDPDGEYRGAEMRACVITDGGRGNIVSRDSFLSENDRKWHRRLATLRSMASQVCETPELAVPEVFDFEGNAIGRSLYGFASHQEGRSLWRTGIMDKLAWDLGFHTKPVHDYYAPFKDKTTGEWMPGSRAFVVHRRDLRKNSIHPLRDEMKFRAMIVQAWMPTPELAAKLEAAHEKELIFERKVRPNRARGEGVRREATSSAQSSTPLPIIDVQGSTFLTNSNYPNIEGIDDTLVRLMINYLRANNSATFTQIVNGVTDIKPSQPRPDPIADVVTRLRECNKIFCVASEGSATQPVFYGLTPEVNAFYGERLIES